MIVYDELRKAGPCLTTFNCSIEYATTKKVQPELTRNVTMFNTIDISRRYCAAKERQSH